MQPRMTQPAVLVPGAMDALRALGTAAENTGLPKRTAELVHLRASQMNGCSTCVHGAALVLRHSGETDDRLDALAAWRDAPFYTEPERAALALTEALTRLDAGGEPVPAAVWDEAARHYEELPLAGLLLFIANSNVWNRLNLATRQIAGAWKP